jgi:hypothetical protein
MNHLIAPSSMLEVAPTSINSSSQKGMRTHHPSVSRSRRDTPSLEPASMSFGARRLIPQKFKSAHRSRVVRHLVNEMSIARIYLTVRVKNYCGVYLYNAQLININFVIVGLECPITASSFEMGKMIWVPRRP